MDEAHGVWDEVGQGEELLASGAPDPAALEACVRRMQAASDMFHGQAVRTGCHGFIEFAGLMNEYINACRDAARAGHDFRDANRHGSVRLALVTHQVRYLEEKLDCIFQGAIRVSTSSSGELDRR